MSARVVVAWILTIFAVLLGLGGFYTFRDTPEILVPGVGGTVVVVGGLPSPVVRGKLGEWGRLTLAAMAFVAGLVCLAVAVLFEALSTIGTG
jgi:hypothetical protein